MWNFAQGYAHLRNDEVDFARVFLNRVLATADSSEAIFRRESARVLLGTLGGILEGEIHRDRGDLDAAIASFQRAVSLKDEMSYDEPERLPFPARHWLGAALLEAERYQDAERVYRAEVADHPHNGWSLFGLKTALEAQGKSSPEVNADLTASWARSDTWLRSSRF